MFEWLITLFKSNYQRWLSRRIPAAKLVTLNQRRIFIFPSRAGFSFLALLLLLLIAAINYQNNMAFALVFLLACVFFVSVLHTYANLSGLTIQALQAKPVFAGDSIAIELRLSRKGVAHYYDIKLAWKHSDQRIVSLLANDEQRISLYLPTSRRGLLRPGRLTIETVYPLGLLRAWSSLALDIEALVYPRPLAVDMKALTAVDGEEGEAMLADGSDDFYGFRDYQAGDSLKNIYWKGYAKGHDLQLKQFSSFRQKQLWLDWQTFNGNIETRLSYLCYWALRLESQQKEYGLRLPDKEIAPAKGMRHQAAVLRSLALYQQGAA